MAYCILYTRLSTREAPGAIPNDSVTILGRFWSDSGAIPNRFCDSGAMWTQAAKSMKINKNIDRRIGRIAIFQKKSIDVLRGLRSRRFFIDIYCSYFQKWRFCCRVAKAPRTIPAACAQKRAAPATRPHPCGHACGDSGAYLLTSCRTL